jgi:hypothetical protein
MAQETKVEETRCSLQTFERNRYFYGKPMTVSDFEAEQRYLIGKHRYINRLVHGKGVLCGLQVTVPKNFSAERPTVEVAEGAALDCCGNLIVVSRSSTVEIKGDFDPDVPNYLYVRYAECSKQPVMLAADGSSCREVCCYNRIQETFEVVASRSAPGAAAAEAEAKLTASDSSGDAPDPEKLCRDLTESYYQKPLRTCPGCDDPLVFLAVLNPEKRELDAEETAKYRTVVYNNEMLHELLCGHVSDFDNPHRTSAEQVRALQSVNSVGNTETRDFVSNIDLLSSDNTLAVKPDKNNNDIDLTLAPAAVKRSHLNEDVFNHLIESSKTVTVTPNVGDRKITLNTTPAAKVSSVGSAPVVGTSGSYAPEDHAHDLSAGVVERKHLSKDVFEKLVEGGGAITVKPDAAAGTITVSSDTVGGDDPKLVTSVTGLKTTGKSERYAREDHGHDLFINGHAPNGSGQFLLTAGTNVSISKGAAENELVIGALGGGGAVVVTGVVEFLRVLPQEERAATITPRSLERADVAIVLSEERLESNPNGPGGLSAIFRFGDVVEFDLIAPLLMATVNVGQKSIEIRLRDRRQGSKEATALKLTDESLKLTDEGAARFASAGETESSGIIAPTGIETDGIILNAEGRDYRVRWWAIPPTLG